MGVCRDEQGESGAAAGSRAPKLRLGDFSAFPSSRWRRNSSQHHALGELARRVPRSSPRAGALGPLTGSDLRTMVMLLWKDINATKSKRQFSERLVRVMLDLMSEVSHKAAPGDRPSLEEGRGSLLRIF